jgi:hypothetical protein
MAATNLDLLARVAGEHKRSGSYPPGENAAKRRRHKLESAIEKVASVRTPRNERDQVYATVALLQGQRALLRLPVPCPRAPRAPVVMWWQNPSAWIIDKIMTRIQGQTSLREQLPFITAIRDAMHKTLIAAWPTAPTTPIKRRMMETVARIAAFAEAESKGPVPRTAPLTLHDVTEM